MGYIKSDLENLKNNLNSLIGEEILIIEPATRRGKQIGLVGTLDSTYDSFFRVIVDDEKKLSYNYTDLFTKDVRIQTFDGNKFKPFTIPRPLTKKETIPTLKITEEISDITSTE